MARGHLRGELISERLPAGPLHPAHEEGVADDDDRVDGLGTCGKGLQPQDLCVGERKCGSPFRETMMQDKPHNASAQQCLRPPSNKASKCVEADVAPDYHPPQAIEGCSGQVRHSTN